MWDLSNIFRVEKQGRLVDRVPVCGHDPERGRLLRLAVLRRAPGLPEASRRFGLASAQLAEDEHAVLNQADDTLRLDLARAIQSLPPQYRTVVIMRDMEERTVGEVAEALHLTREAVKRRLHRARSLLREYLVR